MAAAPELFNKYPGGFVVVLLHDAGAFQDRREDYITRIQLPWHGYLKSTVCMAIQQNVMKNGCIAGQKNRK